MSNEHSSCKGSSTPGCTGKNCKEGATVHSEEPHSPTTSQRDQKQTSTPATSTSQTVHLLITSERLLEQITTERAVLVAVVALFVGSFFRVRLALKIITMIQFDSCPVIYFFVVASFLVMYAQHAFPRTRELFSSPARINWGVGFRHYQAEYIFRSFSHVIGHHDWDHFWNNMSAILIVGPACEVAYGSGHILLYILAEAISGTILQGLRHSHYGVLGASGVINMFFMMQGFIKSTNNKGIPFAVVLLVVVRARQEWNSVRKDENTFRFGHIVGAFVGFLFGYLGAAYEQNPDICTAKCVYKCMKFVS